MTYHYQSDGWRPDPKQLGKIIDIGGANSFCHGYLDAVVDIRDPQADANHKFVGNIDFPEIWQEILKHVKKHGKWDYAVCTHTLEDINNPLMATQYIQQIASKGLVIVPSKYRELVRFSGSFRGFIHHRWIFDVRDNEFIALPKINYIEDSHFDNRGQWLEGREELVIQWEGKINMKYLNDGMPYGNETISGEDHIKQLYNML